MEPGRSSSLPTMASSSSPKKAASSLLKREMDKHQSVRQRAVSLASIEPFAGSAGRINAAAPLPAKFAARPAAFGAPSGPTPAGAAVAKFAAPSTYVPKYLPPQPKPPAPPAPPAPHAPGALQAPSFPAPMVSAHGVKMNPDFARRMETKARLNKESNSKKRPIDLIKPSYAAAPKAGGLKAKKGRVEAMLQHFSPQQQIVVDMIQAGKSVFFTGSAGTGKSLLPKQTTFVTASTGMAAINIGGITLHQFAGIGLGADPAPVLLQRVLKGKAKENWLKVRVLIIDEVSMVDAELFEKIEYIAREVRKNPYPFGGIQLVCCGDFFQLPPVSRTNSATFAFESSKWAQTIQCNIELTTVYRQSDSKFVSILNELRHGKISPEAKRILDGCKTATLKVPEGIEPTRLYPLNKDVDGMNQGLLSALPGNTREFKAVDKGDEPFRSSLQNHSSAPTVLQLKEGAQVILLKGLANGARGVVIGFNEEQGGLPIVRFISGIEKTIEHAEWPIEIAGHEVASRSQVPLRLGWAISIHKSQGLTLTFAEVSLASVFEFGQAYVALSRVSSLAGLKLLDFDPKAVRAHPKVVKFYETFDDMAHGLLATASQAPVPAAAQKPPAAAPVPASPFSASGSLQPQAQPQVIDIDDDFED